MGHFKTCSDSHDQILYVGEECPVCKIRVQLDEALDAKVDIDTENIFNLDKRVAAIEKIVLTADAKKAWWRSS